MFLTHLSCSAEQSWLADIILLFMLCTVRADSLTSYCYSCSALLADIILLLALCFACWHHTAISHSAFCQAELTCWHYTIKWSDTCWHCYCHSLSFADIILLFLVLCSACWHHTVTSHALLCLLISYYQISMFHSWTKCEEIQED